MTKSRLGSTKFAIGQTPDETGRAWNLLRQKEAEVSQGSKPGPRRTATASAPLWIGTKVLVGIIWFYVVVFLMAGDVRLLGRGHQFFGVACLIVTVALFFTGVYVGSPRFKSGNTKIGWTDFKVWTFESAGATWEAVKVFFKWAVGLAVVGGACSLLVAGYQQLDADGWIAHTHDTPIWIQGNWLVGEYRTCQLVTTTTPMGAIKPSGELPRLLCGKNVSDKIDGSLFEFEEVMPNTSDAIRAVFSKDNWSDFDSYFHVLRVTYYGRIVRPDKVFDSWRCQRNDDSLSCKALN